MFLRSMTMERHAGTEHIICSTMGMYREPFGTFSYVCMCLCIYVCLYVCIESLLERFPMHVCVYVYMYVDLYVSRAFWNIFLCMYVCMYVCVHARMSACHVRRGKYTHMKRYFFKRTKPILVWCVSCRISKRTLFLISSCDLIHIA